MPQRCPETPQLGRRRPHRRATSDSVGLRPLLLECRLPWPAALPRMAGPPTPLRCSLLRARARWRLQRSASVRCVHSWRRRGPPGLRSGSRAAVRPPRWGARPPLSPRITALAALGWRPLPCRRGGRLWSGCPHRAGALRRGRQTPAWPAPPPQPLAALGAPGAAATGLWLPAVLLRPQGRCSALAAGLGRLPRGSRCWSQVTLRRCTRCRPRPPLPLLLLCQPRPLHPPLRSRIPLLLVQHAPLAGPLPAHRHRRNTGELLLLLRWAAALSGRLGRARPLWRRCRLREPLWLSAPRPPPLTPLGAGLLPGGSALRLGTLRPPRPCALARDPQPRGRGRAPQRIGCRDLPALCVTQQPRGRQHTPLPAHRPRNRQG
jgi:hypothetical protein